MARRLLRLAVLVFLPSSLFATNLTWSGTNGTVWDTNNTTNWTSAGVPEQFIALDNVTFDDTGSTGTVTLSGSVQPSSVTVNNNALAYTFGGTGQIIGSTGLLKSGTGTLTISNTNAYTGGTVISAGTIILTNTSALGSGTIALGDANTGTGSAALLINEAGSGAVTYSRPVVASSGSGTEILGRTGAGSGTVTISSSLALNNAMMFQSSSSGTLNVTSVLSGSGNAVFAGGGVTTLAASTSGTVATWTGGISVTGNSVLISGSASTLFSTNRSMNVAAGSGAAFNGGLGTSYTVGSLSGGGLVGYSGTTSTPANLSVGGSNASSTFDGVIGGGTVAGYAINPLINVTKIGTGTFTLTGGNTYTGTTTISQGRLALSGSGSMSNTPMIKVTSGAVLDVSGLSSGTFALAGGQTLLAGRTSGSAAGTDVAGNLSTGSGSMNIAGTGTAGTLTVSGNLALSGGSLLFDFASVTTAGQNDLISIGGSLSLSGTTTVTPNLLSGSLANGTYTLVSGSVGLTSGNASNLAFGGSLSRQAVTFNTTSSPGSITMTVSGTAANLVWGGTNGNTWDTGTTTNWTNSGTGDKYFSGDNVTFNDSAANGNVTVTGSLTPGSLTVNNNTTNYVFSGTGQIGGLTGLLKTGTGTLTISNTNTYTGGTVISAGTIILTNTSALGSGTIALGDGNTGTGSAALLINESGSGAVTYSRPVVASSGSGTEILGRTGAGNGTVTISSSLTVNNAMTFQSSSSGTLNVTSVLSGSGNAVFAGGGVTTLAASTSGSTATWTGGISVTGNSMLISGSASTLFSTNRSMNVAAGSGAAFNGGLGTSYTVGSLSGGGLVGYSGTTSTPANLSVGGSNASSTFDGVIGGGTVAGYAINPLINVTKIGTGTFTLTGVNTYTGTTTISQGRLALSGSGSMSNTPMIKVTSGAVLDVSGLSSGTFALASGQTLQAGRTSAFTTDMVGNLSTGSGSVNIAGTGTAGTLTVSGNLALSGGSLLYDFANTATAGAGVNDLISIGGSLSLSGTTTITPTLLSGTLANGTYTLVSGTVGITSGNASNLAFGGALLRQAVAFNTTSSPGSITMTVSGTAANLVWGGTNGNTWDAGTTTNWNNQGTGDVFFTGDKVTFDDTAANGNVTVTGSLSPGALTVNNNTTAYLFSGTGQIGGLTGLLKTGTGTLTISNTNTYTGGTVISAGTIILTNTSALGSGTIALGDGNTGTGSAALLINESGSGTVTYSRLVVASSGSGTEIIGRTGAGSGTVTISSSLSLNHDMTFQSSSSGTLNVTSVLSGSGNAVFAGGGVTTLGATTSGSAGAWTGGVSVTGNTEVVTGSVPILFSTNRNVNVDAGSGESFVGGPGFSGSYQIGTLTGAGIIGQSGTLTPVVAVGGSNASSTFGGVIGGGTLAGYVMGSSVNLTKIGTGTFTLTGANTYTGTTTISQGRLALSGNGSIGNTTLINVALGAVLDVSGLSSGTFALAGGQTLQAGRISGSSAGNDVVGNLSTGSGTVNIAGSGTAGTLTVSGNLALSGGSLLYDFANVTTTSANDSILIKGGLSLSGTTVVTPNLLNNALASGTYTLVSGSIGITGGNATNLAWGGPATRQIIAFDTSSKPGEVLMEVSGSSANLVWSGSNGAVWNSSSTVFENTATSGTDKFYQLDNVAFTDSGSNANVVLSGSLQPGSVTVDNNSTAYTFSGSGQITGATTLTKSGSGTLTISTTNSYTGATNVAGGTLTVTGSIASTVTVSAGATLGGHGSVGAIAGSGTIAPGDPVIFTATQVDPSGGVVFHFQFGQPGAPDYTDAAASGNDVIHLTDPTPFKFALTAANVITVDFTGLTLTTNEIFYGGFFTDATVDPSMINGATFVYTGAGGATVVYEGLVAVSEADFQSGTVFGGETMEFMVTAVPEPGTWALLGAGGAVLAVAWKRRRKMWWQFWKI